MLLDIKTHIQTNIITLLHFIKKIWPLLNVIAIKYIKILAVNYIGLLNSKT